MSNISKLRDITIDEIETISNNISKIDFFNLIEKVNDNPDTDINILIKEVKISE